MHSLCRETRKLSMDEKLVVAIASGKGGTGKTTVATNLATVIGKTDGAATYLDCDVEEPNGHIFLKPEIKKGTAVTIPVPVVDESKCNACGKCRDICQFSAIILLKETVLTFPNLCHGCGGCKLVCPTGAITEVGREVGVIEEGSAGSIRFVHGKMRIGEAMSPPLIREVKKRVAPTGVSIIDAPPGTSCPVIESVKNADFVLLVTEPTPFGLNDLKLAVEMLRVLQLPFGVAVNRAGMGNRDVYQYCQDEQIDIILEIPDDRRIAEAYSRGQLAVDALPEYSEKFTELISTIKQQLAQEKIQTAGAK